MGTKKPGGWWIPGVLFSAGCILEGVATVRYVSRQPGDWLGIGLYAFTTVLFAVVAVGFYLQWLKQRRGED